MRSLPLALAFLLLVSPVAARAGTYDVTGCFGAETGPWTPSSSPGLTAYAACPGTIDAARGAIGHGLIVRNVVGRGDAAPGATGGWRFDAPAGTVIVGMEFEARILRSPGWHAGVQDAATGRWLWCGTTCSTSAGNWVKYTLPELHTSRLASVVRCASAHCRRDRPQAFVQLRNVKVHLADGSAPSVGAVGGVPDGWARGALPVAFDAADNSGIGAARLEVAGGPVVHDDPRTCDFSRAVPCENAAIRATLDTRTWPDGEHRLRAGAGDAAGNWAWTERLVRVDNTPPAEPAPALVGGDVWSAARSRTLRIPLPGGQAAPLVRARVSLCRAGGACADAAPELTSDGTAVIAPGAGPGEYAVRVALEDAAGNAGAASPPLMLRFDDTVPGAPDLSAADAWLSGAAPLRLAAEGALPPSGLLGFRVRSDGRELRVPVSEPAAGPAAPNARALPLAVARLPLGEVAEGRTPIEVRAVSGAGVESTAVRTVLRVDRTPPVADVAGAPDASGWSRVPVQLALRGRDQAELSGVASLVWRIGDGPESSAAGDEAIVDVAGDGRHEVAYRAVDAAGNASPAGTVRVAVDRTAPEAVFALPDPADPARVSAVVRDATSGVARGEIELRPAGGAWRALPTTLRDGRLEARIDDGALRAGAYELRARAVDVAGNEATGAARVDGAPAAVTLPLRRAVALRATRRGSVVTLALSDGATPLADRELVLAERLRGRASWRPACSGTTIALSALASGSAATGPCAVRTGADGRVSVRLRRGPSRRIRAAFAGDALLLPARAAVAVRTRARVRLGATPTTVAAGSPVTFAGRLLGGHLPPAGKVVELQARVRGRWRTFATVRSDRAGRVRHVHRFTAASAGRAYAFRLRARSETAYPFETGRSGVITVRVR